MTLVVKWIDHDRSKYQIKKRNVDTKSATLSQYQDIEVANNAQILDVRLCLSSGDYLAIMTKEGSISSLNKFLLLCWISKSIIWMEKLHKKA